MSERWFYRDSLAAAWMAQHFGMKFAMGGEKPLEGVKAVLDSAALGFNKFPIHPDSLHILNAKEGDEGVDAQGHQCLYTRVSWRIYSTLDDGYYTIATPPITIDKRNGIAFMRPEREE